MYLHVHTLFQLIVKARAENINVNLYQRSECSQSMFKSPVRHSGLNSPIKLLPHLHLVHGPSKQQMIWLRSYPEVENYVLCEYNTKPKSYIFNISTFAKVCLWFLMNLFQHGVPWSQSPEASETTEAVSFANGTNGLPLLRVSWNTFTKTKTTLVTVSHHSSHIT